MEATVSYRLITPADGNSPGIRVEPAPRIGAGYRLHQLGSLGFQIFIGNNQSADRRPRVATAGRNRLIHRGFQPVVLFEFRLCRGRHGKYSVLSDTGYVTISFS